MFEGLRAQREGKINTVALAQQSALQADSEVPKSLQ